MANSVVPVEASLDGDDAGHRFDVLIHKRQERLEVTSVDRIDRPEVQRNVLLRHRTRSIASENQMTEFDRQLEWALIGTGEALDADRATER